MQTSDVDFPLSTATNTPEKMEDQENDGNRQIKVCSIALGVCLGVLVIGALGVWWVFWKRRKVSRQETGFEVDRRRGMAERYGGSRDGAASGYGIALGGDRGGEEREWPLR